MSKVLITGASGFIGSNLCRYFADRGFEVHGLVRKTSDLHFLEGLPVRLVVGDLGSPDGFELPAGMDYVVHSASLTSDLASEAECEPGVFRLAVNVFEKLSRAAPRPRRIIYVSTTLILGYAGRNISEAHPGKSAEFLPYTRAKKKAEAFVRETARREGLPVVIVRPGDVYGPNDRTTSAKLLEGLERGVPIIVGHGNWRFPYCYVGNLCQAIYLACVKPGIDGRAYTVTNGELPTWRMLFSRLQAGLGKKQRIYVPVWVAMLITASQELRKRLDSGYVPDVSFYRIRRITTEATYDIADTIADLGYLPDEDLDAQARAIVSWYLEEKRRGFLK
jgi:nucleoside-diphosphate-sugar epimerase